MGNTKYSSSWRCTVHIVCEKAAVKSNSVFLGSCVAKCVPKHLMTGTNSPPFFCIISINTLCVPGLRLPKKPSRTQWHETNMLTDSVGQTSEQDAEGMVCLPTASCLGPHLVGGAVRGGEHFKSGKQSSLMCPAGDAGCGWGLSWAVSWHISMWPVHVPQV